MSQTVREILRASALLLGLIVLQVLFARYLSIGGVAPDLPLVGLIFIAHRLGRLPATALGFGAGVIMDLASGEVVGILALAKTLTGFGSGILYDPERSEPFGRLPRFMGRTAGLVFFHQVLSLLLYFRTLDTDVLLAIVRHGLGGTVYTAVIVLIVVLILSRQSRRVDMQKAVSG